MHLGGWKPKFDRFWNGIFAMLSIDCLLINLCHGGRLALDENR